MIWEHVGVDVVHMPRSRAGSYIVFARDDLTGWLEERPIPEATSYYVAKFLYKEVLCHHGCPRKITGDKGRENLDLTKDLLEHYRVRQTIIAPYHPQANSFVEHGHDVIINPIAKYCAGSPQDWAQYLSLAM
jgi:hypothetical protein